MNVGGNLYEDYYIDSVSHQKRVVLNLGCIVFHAYVD